MTKQSCRSCLHYDLKQATTPTGRIRRGAVARCFWTEPADTPIPVSIRPYQSTAKLRYGGYTAPSDGAECRCYAKRESGAA